MSDKVLLFSGGLDSFIAWFYEDNPKCVYVDLRHRYADKERQAIKVLEQTVPDLSVDILENLRLTEWEHDDAHIPLRNMFFAMLATHYGDDIIVVAQKGEMGVPDRSLIFFHELSIMLTKLLERKVEVRTPFQNMTKTEMVRWYLKVKEYPQEWLTHTVGCFSAPEKGAKLHCADCACCFRRWVAMVNNDVLEYRISRRLVEDYMGRLDQYIPERRAETEKAVALGEKRGWIDDGTA